MLREMACSPHVIQIHDVDATQDAHHIILEFCGGGNLYDRIASCGTLSEQLAARHAKSLAEFAKLCQQKGTHALHLTTLCIVRPQEALTVLVTITTHNYLFAAYIIHNNIKPENIVLVDSSPDAAIKVADFGLARRASEMTEERLGTEGSMAPEAVERGQLSHHSDMYSIGVVLNFMLCGKHPLAYTCTVQSPCQG